MKQAKSNIAGVNVMVYLGDIAVPGVIKPKVDRMDLFYGKTVVANLEGLITFRYEDLIKENKLFSNDLVIDFLKYICVKAVTLANNHVTDVPEAFDRTKEILDANGIQYCGAGLTIEEAQKSVIVDDK